jgi:two-component system phosphate regulon sensor histidine kinase PhoR
VMAVIGSFLVAGRIDRSIERIERATQRLARGDLSARVYPPRIPQLVGLANGFNAMASELRRRVETLTHLSGEQDAILQSMAEGVITVDTAGYIVRVNAAARRLLDVSILECQGRLVPEVVRYAEVQRFITEAIESGHPEADEVVIPGPSETILQAYSSPLKADDGRSLGTLIVLQDTTRIERLENIRRDFIANVSHELRTPITSIKGFVETLLDGAKDDPETLSKFLGIIGHHADRLNSLFHDLLTLARLEARGDDARVESVPCKVLQIVGAAVSSCAVLAKERAAVIQVDVGEDLEIEANPNLLQQALVNLIDNALKYSEGQPRVLVQAAVEGKVMRLAVIDNGPGIARAHLPRIFERFYRVDHGRSRKMGGTGLGLAIVKHITQVHGGTVDVDSMVGRGTTFSLHLPLSPP